MENRNKSEYINYLKNKQLLERLLDSAKIKMDSIKSELIQKHKKHYYYNKLKLKFNNNDVLEYIDDMANKLLDPANTISLAGLGIATALLCSGGGPAVPAVVAATSLPSATIDIYSGIRHLLKDDTPWEGLSNIGLGVLNVLPQSAVIKYIPKITNVLGKSNIGRMIINTSKKLFNAGSNINNKYQTLIDNIVNKFNINTSNTAINTIKLLPKNTLLEGTDDIIGLSWDSKIPIYGDSLRNTLLEIDSLSKEYDKLKDIYYQWIPLPNNRNKDNNKNKYSTNTSYISK